MFGLPDKHIKAIHHCLEDYPGIEMVVIYGSRAKGNHQNGSDIDLMIEGDIDFSQLMRLDIELDDLLLPYKIDLSVKDRINNPDLIAHIERVGKVFYDRTHRLAPGEQPVEYMSVKKTDN